MITYLLDGIVVVVMLVVVVAVFVDVAETLGPGLGLVHNPNLK